MNWEVWYSDGWSVSSDDVPPHEITKRDRVQVIIQGDDEHRWVTVAGYDFYMWDDRGNGDKWFGGDREGLSTYLRQPGYKCVLMGEMIDKVLFRKIMNDARKRLGEKAGYESTERKPD